MSFQAVAAHFYFYYKLFLFLFFDWCDTFLKWLLWDLVCNLWLLRSEDASLVTVKNVCRFCFAGGNVCWYVRGVLQEQAFLKLASYRAWRELLCCKWAIHNFKLFWRAVSFHMQMYALLLVITQDQLCLFLPDVIMYRFAHWPSSIYRVFTTSLFVFIGSSSELWPWFIDLCVSY